MADLSTRRCWLRLHPFDAGSEAAQFLVDFFVAAELILYASKPAEPDFSALALCARRPRPELLRLHSFNAGSKAAQFLVYFFVAAVDVLDVGDFGGTLGAQSGQDHRGAGADVGTDDWHAL